MESLVRRSVVAGAIAGAVLFGLSFGVTSLVSGIDFAWRQYVGLWYWIAALMIGFGIEVGLFAYLRGRNKHHSAGVVAGGGAGSAAAMIACCAHRLADFLPIFGMTLFAAALARYQPYLLAASAIFNLVSIIYLISIIRKHT